MLLVHRSEVWERIQKASGSLAGVMLEVFNSKCLIPVTVNATPTTYQALHSRFCALAEQVDLLQICHDSLWGRIGRRPPWVCGLFFVCVRHDAQRHTWTLSTGERKRTGK